jgi:hypothetical protein
MLSERRLRRALYAVTVLGWVVAVTFAVLDVELGAVLPFTREVLIVSVAVAATLSNVTLFAVIVAPLERVYRHGYEAGRRSSDVTPHARLRVVPRNG